MSGEPKRKKTREERHLEKYLRLLTDSVLICLDRIDVVMKMPESHERGKHIADIVNKLDFANDQARYFGLDMDFRKDDKARATKAALERARK